MIRGRVSGLGWLRGYQPSWLRGDLASGVTTAAVVIPQSMAYATIAGLSVQVGLYVAIVPMVAYAMLGTSRPLSVSTTSTIAALTAAAVGGAARRRPSHSSDGRVRPLRTDRLLVACAMAVLHDPETPCWRGGWPADTLRGPPRVG